MGRHSAILTLSPALTPRQAGQCAEYLPLLFSYLSYFCTYFMYWRSTTTVLFILTVATTPSMIWPLTGSVPWKGQLGSSHSPMGAATSMPMFLISAVISSPNLLDSVLWSVGYL